MPTLLLFIPRLTQPRIFPCSLFPIPYSLFPVPYSLLPTPYSPLPFNLTYTEQSTVFS
ncbi:MAG: hypothetical protein F6K56_19865 [Moorea sp. SIO3G5]|nr:hypothetical protein [Moorena sp. SIO3G5]